MNPNDAPDPTLLPRDPATGEALPPTPQPGYYPGFQHHVAEGILG